jgi:hypothetical protein
MTSRKPSPCQALSWREITVGVTPNFGGQILGRPADNEVHVQ